MTLQCNNLSTYIAIVKAATLNKTVHLIYKISVVKKTGHMTQGCYLQEL